ncbi:hypothetical protein AUR64_00875 [Haloprofundus marisrubri]|uniref:Amphi-Trp domain-containing protein n=1 Tax=Haloprofundus marisrubri TaxID=1514971 RepID=A0A0W1R404_9EURY|nr:hypothetical protein [Haloprofundus marisrubri]KTG08160.1 hypothetical protein AUR64_00875 [Haloprofundus marisrubri]
MAELETSRELSRAEVAAYLREFADELDRRDDGTTHHDEAHRTDTSNRTTGGTTDTHTTESTDATRTSRDSPDTATTAEDNTADTAGTTDETTDGENSQTHSNTNYRKVTFLVGNDSATINPPETVSFDVAVDSDSSLMEAGTRERVDFSIAWDADSVPEDDELRIE